MYKGSGECECVYWLKLAWTIWCLSPIILGVFYILYCFRSKEITHIIAGLSGIIGYIFSQGVIAIASHSDRSAIILVYLLKFFMPLFILLLIEGVREQKWDEVKRTVWALLGFLVMVLVVYFIPSAF